MVEPGDRRGGERGAIVLFTALALVGLLTVTAIVTDLGLQRAMRRQNQNLADLAALAAGPGLADSDGPDGRTACQDAVRYLRLNEAALNTLAVPCTSLPATCDSATTAPVVLTQTVGRFTVGITYPVADATIADLLVGGAPRTEDGEACERLRVAVDRVESTIFGRIVGQAQIRSSASATVRQLAVQNRRVPSLWLLDPYGCDSLTVQGGAQVTVGTSTMGGLISLDSDSSTCTGSSYTVDVGGSGSVLRAIPATSDPPGQLSLFAMRPGQTSCATGNLRACDPSDITNGTLSPTPVRRPWRATRAPVDHLFNCRTSYPSYHGIAMQPCEDSREPHIDRLRAAVGTSGIPTGFQRWTTSNSCNASTVTVTGNWVVDCANFKIGNGTEVTFAGGNVIFNGSVSLTGGSLRFNTANTVATLPSHCLTSLTWCLGSSSQKAAWAYMRSGDLSLSGGALIAERTMIYQHDGTFGINGGSPPRWLAPTEGPFAGLAVWSERSSSGFQINGGASMELEGVFFTPEANPFSLSGGSPFIPQRAQFISYRAAVSGGGTLTLSPNSVHAITLPAPPVALIR